MSYQFRRAVREGVSLIVGLAGGTGSGKTYSALRLASGLAMGKPFVVLDTEAGRAKHYADRFAFDYADLHPPFRPDTYTEAILAADAAQYPVIVVDSMSHEWAGDGGVLDWQDEELDRMAGQDWKKREACKMASWIKPKMSHKQMVNKLLQVRAHLILCFRAEPKIEMTRTEDGKMQILEKRGATGLDGWFPISEKNLPYEMTLSFLLMAERPGVPCPIKLEEQHKAFFPPNRPLDENAGSLLAEWAAGGATQTTASPAAISPMASSEMTDAEWLAALTAIDDVAAWSEIKVGVKADLKIADLRKVKPVFRREVLDKIVAAGQTKGVTIHV